MTVRMALDDESERVVSTRYQNQTAATELFDDDERYVQKKKIT